MHRILLVEDSPDSEALIKQALEDQFTVVSVSLAQQARQNLDKEIFDLVLMDGTLPDGDGFSLCEELRKSKKNAFLPVIFLTGRTERQDRIQGFSVGADDYIVKPFDPLELRARIAAKLRRSAIEPQKTEALRRGSLTLQMTSLRALHDSGQGERDLALTPIEFKLLNYFFTHETEVVSREQLLKTLWGQEIHIVTRAIDRHISSLRRKLPTDAQYIESVYGSGYVFSVPAIA